MKVIGQVPYRSRSVIIREGRACLLHELEGRELVAALFDGLHKVGGVDVCAECIERCRAYLRGKPCDVGDVCMTKAADLRRVTVCSACLRASCWQGVFYCAKYRTAGTAQRTIKELKELALEDRSFWEGDVCKGEPD